MGWSNAPPPKPPPLGEWEAISYGQDYHAWVLRCGGMFWAYIVQAADFHTVLNGAAVGSGIFKTLQEAQDAAERAIITKVREMLPAYRIVYGRVMHRDGRPPDDDRPPPGAPGLRAVAGGGKRNAG